MTSDLKAQILDALSRVKTEGGDVVSENMVSGLQLTRERDVIFALEVDPAMGPKMEPLRIAAEKAVRNISGIKNVTVMLTAERAAAPDPHGMNKNPPLVLPFRNVIAVGSGKGGVGKSTVAFNLAAELAAMGYSVALLDADIYGPSVPRLTGLTGQKPVTNDSGKIIPLEAHGLKIMSMGFLVEEEKPMIWRGPMVQTAFYQMLRDVAWRNDDNDLDFLIIDMPPGTGDVQLTLAQKVPVTGAVIVSTPQDLSLIDARKAIAMFEKTNVKVLGIIENMSTFICSNCGHEEHIFGHGGAREEALRRNVSFIGEIPLNAEIRQKSDAGRPVSGIFYKNIAKAVLDSVKSAQDGSFSN
jgi:ATP-binding protein involved in chromosome partitioning